MTTHPMGNGRAWKSTSQPVGIEFDFNLFESHGQRGIAVSGTCAVKNGGRPINQAPAEVGLIQIPPEHENRQHRPIVRVLRDPSVAEIYDSADDDPIGLVQCIHG
jgi:hypothetical protein